MKKVVIAGASVYGLNNLSDDAMLTVFCDELRNVVPRVEITMLARHPGPDLDAQFGVKSIANLDHQRREDSRGRWFNGLNPHDPPDNLRGIRQAIEEADLLIMGGDPFIDITIGLYKGITPYTVLLFTLAKFMGIPTMIHGVHMGRPLETEIGVEQTKFCVGLADSITVREPHSIDVFREMGVERLDHIIPLAEAGYGLQRIEGRKMGEQVLEKENIQPAGSGLMGVTFRHMYWRWKNEEWARYSDMVARLCDYMVEEYDLDVIFIPHNTYEIDHRYMNDRPGHDEITAQMKHGRRAHPITSRLSLQETLSLFPLLDITFSNRRHTAMFAALHGVVGMGVGELHHVKPPMEQLGIGGDKFVAIEDFSFELFRDNLTAIWEDKETILKNINQRYPDLRAQALGNAQKAAEFLQ